MLSIPCSYFLKKLILHVVCFFGVLQMYESFRRHYYTVCGSHLHNYYNQPDIFLCQKIYDMIPGTIHASRVSIIGSNFPELATPE